MGNDPFVPLEWLFWSAAIISAAVALLRAESLASNTGAGVRNRGIGQMVLWLICAAVALTGFILAVVSMHTG
ncbi:hypothetical protein KIH31_16725 [Paenarthrobacter sp. DKR-5]|uniref:hypothetical protein n=1 Tax=Paenarthrobacter sp. DKR-5 TaxID=2835535 RepID=UPI001BDBF980|nr:hypothetical protein [Paenarthrobacter sp. DKR-5]MBT1004233.1 hypothetical protein [Paenarthrobacter sp. DKR-5]